MSTVVSCSMAALQRVTLGVEIRAVRAKYIGERRTKALSTRSKLVSLRFRSSLFTIFFEPRMSDYQGKLYKTLSDDVRGTVSRHHIHTK